jgi:NTP pyrophosphatase (non-canonical NTP hydrolase)
VVLLASNHLAVAAQCAVTSSQQDVIQLRGGDMDIRSAQKLAWANKVAKGFNTTDVPLEFCLLQGEIAEAFDAWRKGREDVGEELADVAVYLLSLAEMTGVDLQNQIKAKMAKNAARAYRPLPNGVLTKSSGEAQPSPGAV